jgi:hypothetical protein
MPIALTKVPDWLISTARDRNLVPLVGVSCSSGASGAVTSLFN